HLRLLQASTVVLELLLQLRDLRLEGLHRSLRLDLLYEDREQDGADRQHEEDDREDPVPVSSEPVADTHRVKERMPLQQQPRDRWVDPSHHGAVCLRFPLARRGGTGSYPPRLKGWQRRSRQVASPRPRSTPCVEIAPIA